MYLCKGYALKYIRKYSFSKNVSLELDDLTQEAILGLLHAAEIYDPEKGCSFSSYAVYWIEHQIRRYIEDKSELIRKPASMHAKIRQVHKLSKTMSDEDITAASGIDASEVRFIRILDNTELVSLNSEIVINGNRSCEIEEAVGDGTDLVEDIEQKEILDGARNYVTNMKDTESRNIMMWYLGYVDDKKTYSYADVAEITGQTKYRIRKTVEDTFRTLRLNFG
ncbi:MAG: sigma-70 family RNA polymerase sigma factor [Clostridia bacterium]|nr:sigma-70 family RNA polymerase sigma factor [Clostridia bacterium]